MLCGFQNTGERHNMVNLGDTFQIFGVQVIGFIKGKSAIHMARNYLEHRRNFTGQQFSAGGYHVSTVGRDEDTVREYIRSQENEDKRFEQLIFFR